MWACLTTADNCTRAICHTITISLKTTLHSLTTKQPVVGFKTVTTCKPFNRKALLSYFLVLWRARKIIYLLYYGFNKVRPRNVLSPKYSLSPLQRAETFELLRIARCVYTTTTNIDHTHPGQLLITGIVTCK